MHAGGKRGIQAGNNGKVISINYEPMQYEQI